MSSAASKGASRLTTSPIGYFTVDCDAAAVGAGACDVDPEPTGVWPPELAEGVEEPPPDWPLEDVLDDPPEEDPPEEPPVEPVPR